MKGLLSSGLSRTTGCSRCDARDRPCKKGPSLCYLDTGITFNAETYGPARGVPKLCVLSPNLAVGFAGDVHTAIEALTHFPTGRLHQNPAAYFVDVHRSKNGVTDFLLLFNSPPRIVK